MNQHESPHQRPYSFGRDRYRRGPQHDDASQYTGSVPAQTGATRNEMAARSEMVPPPPAGHRGMVTVVVLYLVAGFMLLWTGATVAVTIEAVGEQDGGQIMIGMFMAAGSLAITAGLGSWLIRIHRRRGRYQRILDAHYAQRFGHHPDGV
ncbi:hypothetical protein GCM10023354_21060 [Garicola koreensis]|uniref:hypothetical protein n=1 Tax=Garicola koreensis TaxID=1262554 RepID=UPI0031EF6561